MLYNTAAHAKIGNLQQENTFLRKQLATKPSTTYISRPPSRCTISPTFSSPSKHSPSPNDASPPLPKVTKLKRDDYQSSLAAITSQFSSSAERTGFKLIHVPFRFSFSLQQLRSNFCRLYINTRQTLDTHYPNKNLISFLVHIGYETNLRSQLSKFNITVRNDFDPLAPSIICDPTLINEPIDYKAQRACKAFLHSLCRPAAIHNSHLQCCCQLLCPGWPY
ncbi:hypothetical protein RO3G_07230 [Rhizopus delemar RA 99-880]|uniref:Uncharacterized protein n=1 Tax=Rhizopus delemar (strain RA 99-880 / ATCC MYA-4621 / FGSC 9543 / NRRL 43880) TaxID=246409 RepID=I1C245_RHIO9|nr:hypothetical protein RO3G_07230 [Rhizopus delemar RA 99-880]|eukprot:EIE82525.1 hypothetical protein RO3G_07230 [Rhizopus delemar RA 99-880]